MTAHFFTAFFARAAGVPILSFLRYTVNTEKGGSSMKGLASAAAERVEGSGAVSAGSDMAGWGGVG